MDRQRLFSPPSQPQSSRHRHRSIPPPHPSITYTVRHNYSFVFFAPCCGTGIQLEVLSLHHFKLKSHTTLGARLWRIEQRCVRMDWLLCAYVEEIFVFVCDRDPLGSLCVSVFCFLTLSYHGTDIISLAQKIARGGEGTEYLNAYSLALLLIRSFFTPPPLFFFFGCQIFLLFPKLNPLIWTYISTSKLWKRILRF